MSMKHTPEPWVPAEWSPRDGIVDIVDSRDNTICAVGAGCLPTVIADARLIAAAPELLEAAQAAVAALSQNATFPADIAAAKTWLAAAIAKALVTE